MKREAVRAFLKAGADELTLLFDAGRLTEFNSLANKGFPFLWVQELKAASEFGGSGAMLIDDWTVRIRIAKQDTPDSLQEDYERIVDECDYIARKLIWQYNIILMGASQISTANQDLYKLVTISDIDRPPFYKWGADCLTGVDLNFTINTPDKTDVCP